MCAPGPPSGLVACPRPERSETDTGDGVTCGQESGIRGAENLFKMPMRVLLIKTNSAKLNKSNN